MGRFAEQEAGSAHEQEIGSDQHSYPTTADSDQAGYRTTVDSDQPGYRTSQESRQPQKASRERSTIAFPYDDLESAEDVVRALHGGYGGKATRDQIAAELGVSPTSGSFRMKLSTARRFGFVDAGRQAIELTPLGKKLVDDAMAAEARVEGFLNVPLYNALYERFRGHKLPENRGLEEVIRELGVVTKQASVARQAFQRSAQQAGFFNKGGDRLVRPPTDRAGGERESEEDVGGGSEPGSGPTESNKEEPGMQADPLLASLFKRLPPPDKGFNKRERDDFVTALEAIFRIVYGPTENKGHDTGGEASRERQEAAQHPTDRSRQDGIGSP